MKLIFWIKYFTRVNRVIIFNLTSYVLLLYWLLVIQLPNFYDDIKYSNYPSKNIMLHVKYHVNIFRKFTFKLISAIEVYFSEHSITGIIWLTRRKYLHRWFHIYVYTYVNFTWKIILAWVRTSKSIICYAIQFQSIYLSTIFKTFIQFTCIVIQGATT